jgi:hypothetical protein
MEPITNVTYSLQLWGSCFQRQPPIEKWYRHKDHEGSKTVFSVERRILC